MHLSSANAADDDTGCFDDVVRRRDSLVLQPLSAAASARRRLKTHHLITARYSHLSSQPLSTGALSRKMFAARPSTSLLRLAVWLDLWSDVGLLLADFPCPAPVLWSTGDHFVGKLSVSLLGHLSLPSFRGRQISSNPCNYVVYGMETIKQQLRIGAGQSQ